MISLVIPTFNEAAVIEETLRRTSAALRLSGDDFEIIVVDDSSCDGTAERTEALGGELPVRVLRRPGRQGLASAVVNGWAMARGDLLGVMDADLQHPPEVLGELARALRSPAVDLAIGSRHVPGGGTSRWPWSRRLVSWSATHLAASVLPWTLAAVSDPMSGLFIVRATALDGVSLSPVGYKILIEVLAKARYRELVEVPYVFLERGRGSSKAGIWQGVEYLMHLGRLARSTGQLRAWIFYGVIGLAGAGVDIVGLYLLAGRGGWRLAVALPFAIQLALLSNFTLNHMLTFRTRRTVKAAVLARFFRYEAICVPGAVLNALVTLLVASRGVGLLLAAAMGVLADGLWNLFFNVPAIWRTWAPHSSPEPLGRA